MPTYAYTCTACGHSLEARQSFSDAALTECPECSGRLRKRFDAVGVVFKGSGFYRNDSRSEGKGSGSSQPSSGSSTGSGSSGEPSTTTSKPSTDSSSTSGSSSSSSTSSSSSSSTTSSS